MTVLKGSAALEGFLRKPDTGIAALLIYGEELDAVRELAAKAVKRYAGTVDDPFTVVVLQDADLSSDPARLTDEVQALSMFGGNRAIWIKGADQYFLKAATPLLEGKVSGNMVIAEAGPLSPKFALRSAFEKSAHAHAVALYEADANDISHLVASILSKKDLAISEDAIHRFIELVGTSRGLVLQEVEKLSLYCHGAQHVSLADVEAICGNDTGADPDALADSVFQGDVEEVDQLFQALLFAGLDAGWLTMVAHNHVLRLEDFRIAIEKGMKADQVIRSSRPPVFFKRQGKVQAQLQAWTIADLVQAGSTLGAAVAQIRLNPSLGEAIASRCLLSLARKARSLRSERR